MQNGEIFAMRSYIRDLTQVMHYFIYVERTENVLLLRQLKKDRRRVISEFIQTIEEMERTGNWVKGYIGNKFVELSEGSTVDGESPLKEEAGLLKEDKGGMRELIHTEKFLYEEDMQKAYIRESMGLEEKQKKKKKAGAWEIDEEEGSEEHESIQKKKKKGSKGSSKEKTPAPENTKERQNDTQQQFESDASFFQYEAAFKAGQRENSQQREALLSENAKDRVELPQKS